MAQLKAAAVSLSLSPLPCFSIVCHRSKRHITKVSPLLFSEQMRSPQRFQDHSFGGEVWVFIFIPSAAHTKTRTQSRGILIERDPQAWNSERGTLPTLSVSCMLLVWSTVQFRVWRLLEYSWSLHVEFNFHMAVLASPPLCLR